MSEGCVRVRMHVIDRERERDKPVVGHLQEVSACNRSALQVGQRGTDKGSILRHMVQSNYCLRTLGLVLTE